MAHRGADVRNAVGHGPGQPAGGRSGDDHDVRSDLAHEVPAMVVVGSVTGSPRCPRPGCWPTRSRPALRVLPGIGHQTMQEDSSASPARHELSTSPLAHSFCSDLQLRRCDQRTGGGGDGCGDSPPRRRDATTPRCPQLDDGEPAPRPGPLVSRHAADQRGVVELALVSTMIGRPTTRVDRPRQDSSPPRSTCRSRRSRPAAGSAWCRLDPAAWDIVWPRSSR